jgi:glycosyltransferase involved in cell wall biosynthesis
MLKLIKDSEKYEEMSTNALRRSKEFTWETFTGNLDMEVEQSVKQRH